MLHRTSQPISAIALISMLFLAFTTLFAQPAEAFAGGVVRKTTSFVIKKTGKKSTRKAIKQTVKQGAKIPAKVGKTLENNPKVLKTCEKLGMTGIIVSGGSDVAKHALRGEIETTQSNGTLKKEQGPISMSLPKSINSLGESLQWPLLLFSGIVGLAIAIAIIKSAGAP